MRGLEVDFKFHNVGQGLFYTGRLKYGRAFFNFVYDCGAWEWGKDDYYTNLVKNAIRGEFSKYDTIDLLIISHLHADHTNGIPYLLNRVKEVDTVILPYLTPIERLIVALETPVASREFYNFLADPVMFLLDHGAKRVILVGGEEPSREEYWRSPTEGYPEEGASFDIRIDMPDVNIDRIPEDLKSEYGEDILQSLIKNGRLLIKEHRRRILVLLNGMPVWLFRLFNCKVSPTKLSDFKNCVRDVLKGGSIKEAIKNRSIHRKLKKCYTKLTKGLNETSLMVLHFPLFDPKTDFLLVSSNSTLCDRLDILLQKRQKSRYYLIQAHQTHNAFHYKGVWESKLGMELSQFLTGDINMKNKYGEIRAHFGLGSIVKKTAVTLVPHHCSEKSWLDIDINNPCPLHRDISSRFWIVSAGIHNRHGHPSPLVCWDISNHCPDYCVVWVNETTYFRLMGTLQF